MNLLDEKCETLVILDDFWQWNYHSHQVIPTKRITPIDGILDKNQGEDGSEQVRIGLFTSEELIPIPV